MPGGRHAHGKTENKLILFADGSYLELIAFVDEDSSAKNDHWWRDHDCGFVDWALTTPKHEDLEELLGSVNELDGPIKYGTPKVGGRRRPDGQDIEWKFTSALYVRRGYVPFWCLDITERDLRVPISNRALTTHPCGATGVAQISLHTSARDDSVFFDRILGSDKQVSAERTYAWPLLPVKEGEAYGLPLLTIHSSDSRLVGHNVSPTKLNIDNGHDRPFRGITSLTLYSKEHKKPQDDIIGKAGTNQIRIGFFNK